MAKKKDAPESAAQPELALRQIDVAKIQPNPRQPRQRFDETALAELGASIKEKGVIQPITVRDVTQGATEAYELIAGERRWRACQLIDRPTVPAIVLQVSGGEAVEMAFVENLQREDLTPMEEARALAGLMEQYGDNKSKVMERIGKSATFVNDRLALLELPEKVQEMLDAGRINTAQSKVILEIEGAEQQIRWAEEAAKRNLDANRLKGMTQHLAKKPSSTRDKRGRAVSYKGMTSSMISLYEDTQALPLAKLSDNERSTLAQQAEVLINALEELREQLANPRTESSGRESEEQRAAAEA